MRCLVTGHRYDSVRFMAKTCAPIDLHYQSQLVLSQYRKEKEVWKKERLLAFKLLLQTEKIYQEVSAIVGCSESQIRVWARL